MNATRAPRPRAGPRLGPHRRRRGSPRDRRQVRAGEPAEPPRLERPAGAPSLAWTSAARTRRRAAPRPAARPPPRAARAVLAHGRPQQPHGYRGARGRGSASGHLARRLATRTHSRWKTCPPAAGAAGKRLPSKPLCSGRRDPRPPPSPSPAAAASSCAPNGASSGLAARRRALKPARRAPAGAQPSPRCAGRRRTWCPYRSRASQLQHVTRRTDTKRTRPARGRRRPEQPAVLAAIERTAAAATAASASGLSS